MNEHRNMDLGNLENNNLDVKKIKKGSLSDTAFLPAWLLGTAIAVVIVLTVLSGWKIVNLEMERADLVTQRRLLDRDMKAVEMIRKDLPVIEERYHELNKKQGKLEGKVQSTETRLESLIAQADIAQFDRDKAKEELIASQAKAKTNRELYSDLQNKIVSGRSESKILSQKIDALSAQEKSLRETSGNLQVLVKQLQADISGLESQRRNKQQALELMTHDISEFNSLSKRFDSIASKYEKAHQNVQNSIKSINAQSSELKKAVGDVNENANKVSNQIEILSSETGKLKIADKDIQDVSQNIIGVTGDIKEAKIDLVSSTDKLHQAAVKLDHQSQLLNQSIKGPLNQLHKTFSDFESHVARIPDTNTNFNNSINVLNGKITLLGSNISDFQNELSSTQNIYNQMSTYTSKLNDVINDSVQTRSELSKELRAMQELIALASSNFDEETGSIFQYIKSMESKLITLDTNLQQIETTVRDIRQGTLDGIEITNDQN